jgi:hypothetical protein
MASPRNVPGAPKQLHPLCYPYAEFFFQIPDTLSDLPGFARISIVNAVDDAGGHDCPRRTICGHRDARWS